MNPKKHYGSLKPSMSYVPANALLHVMEVFRGGADKYGKKNWRIQPVDVSTYYDAAMRHLVEFYEQGKDRDDESGQHPLAHVAACCLIVIDGLERGSLIDDRQSYEVLTRDTSIESVDMPGDILARALGIEDRIPVVSAEEGA